MKTLFLTLILGQPAFRIPVTPTQLAFDENTQKSLKFSDQQKTDLALVCAIMKEKDAAWAEILYETPSNDQKAKIKALCEDVEKLFDKPLAKVVKDITGNKYESLIEIAAKTPGMRRRFSKISSGMDTVYYLRSNYVLTAIEAKDSQIKKTKETFEVMAALDYLADRWFSMRPVSVQNKALYFSSKSRERRVNAWKEKLWKPYTQKQRKKVEEIQFGCVSPVCILNEGLAEQFKITKDQKDAFTKALSNRKIEQPMYLLLEPYLTDWQKAEVARRRPVISEQVAAAINLEAVAPAPPPEWVLKLSSLGEKREEQ